MSIDVSFAEILATQPRRRRPFVSAPALLSLWEGAREGAACCPMDAGRLVTSVWSADAECNLYALECVACGWRTPRFVVIRGTPTPV